MTHLDTLRTGLIQLLSKYPIDSYRGNVPLGVTERRYILEIEFLRNENVTLKKMGLAAMQGYAVTLDEVQRIINDTICNHFKLGVFESLNADH